MMFKCFLLFLALCSIPAQTQGSTLPQQRIVFNGLLEQLLDGIKLLENVENIDISAIIGEIATEENLAQILLIVLDYYSYDLPKEALCMIQVILESDEEIQATAQAFLTQVLRWLKLVEQRELELNACDDKLGENPGLIAVAQQQKCKVQVNATTAVGVTAAAADVRFIFWELRDVFPQALLCVAF